MFRKILLFLIITIFIFSCTDHENAIFYYLENEEEEIDRSLNNELSISHMDIDASDNLYIAAGTSNYIRRGTTWNRLSFPSGTDLSTALVVIDPAVVLLPVGIYGGFLDGSSPRFYSSTDLGSTTPNWTEIVDPLLTGKQIVRLKVINDAIFAITFDDGYYNIYFSTNGTTFQNTNIGNQSSKIFDIVYDGAEYWAITETQIYTGLRNNLTSKNVSEYSDITDDFRGVYYSVFYNKYYISNNNGKVFSSPNGNNPWTESSTMKVSNDPVKFTLLSEVDGNILLGTVGNGYYEMIGGSISSLSRLDEFTSADLYGGWVLDFVINGNMVYFLTAGSGLWSNTYYIGATGWGDNWVHE